MLHPSVKVQIEKWIGEAPDSRRVESEALAFDVWESKALEGGQVVYEEVDLDTDEPILHLLAAWCERQTEHGAKPLAKTTGAIADALRVSSKNR